jgi:hypothetical protein
MAASKTLVWRGNASGASMQPNLYEGIALDAMLPGTLVEPVATGIQTSDNADTDFTQTAMFANRDVMRQKNMDQVWVINESMQAVEFRSGEFGCVRVAAAQNITKRRTGLASNGDGTLKIAAIDGTDNVLVYTDEIINTGGAVALVNVYKD